MGEGVQESERYVKAKEKADKWRHANENNAELEGLVRELFSKCVATGEYGQGVPQIEEETSTSDEVAREVESGSNTSPEASRKRVLPRSGSAESQSKKPRKAILTPSKQLLVTEFSKISAELKTGVTQLNSTLEKFLALEQENLEFARSRFPQRAAVIQANPVAAPYNPLVPEF